ncbi:hypothetical protein PHYBLDRAFT_166785 [Phycomyces blakesleeanus NRRL 1555(-)]|uniref:DDE Tnp4 domain-containing protein n=1 Tax=Phycomyces blakesleeanus (strain ATCC 8743b / DSM 1359 / FGSC 10004 / NBRC 33097 / NRRL 1555) TaxID=763407 RepID=A0A162NMD2_PHYB8|nr:hypothetical protein PHYBLDRAFT_166785 [Phycomyces blakesleeanus NRRL 1555(-)]OAD75548.1 hypothetical protein PHYBLDRAFT_166785 [Phycomyces blakesleeanus NRRL 1555(-)]|eukprot:XP_018293588.1 hypothetical protein PHYBLDRAFT_166785 [Phycomyces blakesleeanus NRRL 1555(-)]
MPFNSCINNVAKVLELSKQAFRDKILGKALDQVNDQTEALELLHIQEAERIVISLCQQDHLDISTVLTEECKFLFRFTYTERNSSTVLSVSATEALAILLRKMSFPCRLLDLSLLFGRNSTDVSHISNHVVHLLHLKFGRAMIYDYHQFRPENLMKFSNAIRALGIPVKHCVGFLDGTFKKTARPTKDQKTKAHSLNYQAVVTPGRITSSFYNPVAGRCHDMTVFHKSDIEMHMRKAFDFRSIGESCYHLYADRGYASSEFVMCSFAENSPEYIVNQDMSSSCVVVENEFAHVRNLFAYVNYTQTQRILQGNVSSYYIVAMLFKNLHVCYNRGNQTTMRFKVSSPTPMEYITDLLNH